MFRGPLYKGPVSPLCSEAVKGEWRRTVSEERTVSIGGYTRDRVVYKCTIIFVSSHYPLIKTTPNLDLTRSGVLDWDEDWTDTAPRKVWSRRLPETGGTGDYT